MCGGYYHIYAGLQKMSLDDFISDDDDDSLDEEQLPDVPNDYNSFIEAEPSEPNWVDDITHNKTRLDSEKFDSEHPVLLIRTRDESDRFIASDYFASLRKYE